MARGGGHFSSHHSSHHSSHRSYHRSTFGRSRRSSYYGGLGSDDTEMTREANRLVGLIIGVVYIMVILFSALGSNLRSCSFSSSKSLHSLDGSKGSFRAYLTDTTGVLDQQPFSTAASINELYQTTGVWAEFYFVNSGEYYSDTSLSHADDLYNYLFSDEQHLIFIIDNASDSARNWQFTYYYGADVDKAINKEMITQGLISFKYAIYNSSYYTTDEALSKICSQISIEASNSYANSSTTSLTVGTIIFIVALISGVIVAIIVKLLKSKADDQKVIAAKANPDQYKSEYDDLILEQPIFEKPLSQKPLSVKQPKKPVTPKPSLMDDNISMEDALADLENFKSKEYKGNFVINPIPDSVPAPEYMSEEEATANSYKLLSQNEYYAEHRKPFTTKEATPVSEKPEDKKTKLKTDTVVEVEYTSARDREKYQNTDMVDVTSGLGALLSEEEETEPVFTEAAATEAEEVPVEEALVEETPVEETLVEETPAEETLAEETPVEETPVEEAPVEEVLSDHSEEERIQETKIPEEPKKETDYFSSNSYDTSGYDLSSYDTSSYDVSSYSTTSDYNFDSQSFGSTSFESDHFDNSSSFEDKQFEDDPFAEKK